MSVTRITEKKIVRIMDTSDYTQPVCLAWIGPHGDMRHWVFGGNLKEVSEIFNEVRSRNLTSHSSWRPYDLQYIEAFEKILSKSTQEMMDIVATDVRDYNITDSETSDLVVNSERDYLKTLPVSPYVILLLNPFTWDTAPGGIPVGPSWMRVFIDGKSFNFGDKGNGHYSLKFTLIKQPDQILQL